MFVCNMSILRKLSKKKVLIMFFFVASIDGQSYINIKDRIEIEGLKLNVTTNRFDFGSFRRAVQRCEEKRDENLRRLNTTQQRSGCAWQVIWQLWTEQLEDLLLTYGPISTRLNDVKVLSWWTGALRFRKVYQFTILSSLTHCSYSSVVELFIREG